MTAIELLNWARGPVLQFSLVVFIIGMLIRILEIWLLGRKKDMSQPRSTGIAAGMRTVFTRNVAPPGMWSHLISGYIFHLGFIIVLFLS